MMKTTFGLAAVAARAAPANSANETNAEPILIPLRFFMEKLSLLLRLALLLLRVGRALAAVGLAPRGVELLEHGGQPLPRTMLAYEMQGTPTTVLIDAQGRRRLQVFGVHDDLLLGAEIAMLLEEINAAPG